uniref:Uncharacterized protein n=1 Tax=Rhizophora mucronata TaxID=61149 RepID=A0A2P2MFX4_RHIMU
MSSSFSLAFSACHRALKASEPYKCYIRNLLQCSVKQNKAKQLVNELKKDFPRPQ